MRLFTELKRRNVIRMAVLYVVAAWVVMQVAGVLIDLGALPAWSGLWVLAALAIGFPIALLISWFYEITPEGVALEKDVGPDDSITHVTGRRTEFIVISLLCAGLILFAYDKWWPEGPIERSIAVLAFDNMSGDPGEEYFSDGISEEILNLLAQIKSIKVIARKSSFSFKGKDVDIATIAEQLNVGYVLEGSFRRDDDRVRITAQLIDAKDSTHVWSQTYDRDLSAANLFHIQSEIARAITVRLRTALTETDEQRLANVPTENTEAYAAYLLGRQWLADRKVEELGKAAEQFAMAIELDPNFAGAYSGLADACFLHHGYSGGHVHASCPARESPESQDDYRHALVPLARKAVELDNNLGEAWVSLAMMLHQRGIGQPENLAKLKEVHAAFERGLALNPSQAQGYHWYWLTLGHLSLYDNSLDSWLAAWKEGMGESIIKRGLEVDPLSIPLHNILADFPGGSRTKEAAFQHARRIIEIAPDSPRGYERLGELSWEVNGRLDEAIKYINKSAEIDRHHPIFPEIMALAYATLGDLGMAFAYFERVQQMLVPSDPMQDDMKVAEAAAWLTFTDEHSVQKARAKLQQVDPGNLQRARIEASLAIAGGSAVEWLAENGQYFSECLEAPIDEAYLDNCPDWLDRVLQEVGQQDRARTAIEKRIEIGQIWYDEWPGFGIKMLFTSHLAMLGRTEEALDEFEKVVLSGMRQDYADNVGLRFLLYHDATLDAIREHPRFQALVAEIETDLAQQLENVREMERNGELPTLEELRADLTVD